MDFGTGAITDSIRIVPANGHSALRVGGSNNDIGIFRVDSGNGSTDSANYGFTLKYMGSRAGNYNSLSLFCDQQAGSQIETLTVLQNGFIGLGTASPDYKLDVRDSSAATRIVVRNENNAAGGAGIYLRTFNGATQVSNSTIRTNNSGTLSIFTGTSSEAERFAIDSSGAIQVSAYGSGNNTGTVAQKLAVDSSGNIIETDVEKYLTTTGGTIDTGFTADDFRMLEIIGHANPNSAGSASYRDPIHIYVYNGVGWNGSAVTNYIYTVQIAPLAREVFTSGSSSSANVIEAVFLTGSTESDSCPNSSASSYQARLKISNYGGNSYFQVKVIKRF